MSGGRPAIVARAPNHLGDGVMALPALLALSSIGDLVIQAPKWGRDLYRDVPAEIEPREPILSADIAVLFPPSLRVALQARRARRRIGVDADLRRWLLTDVIPDRTHRGDTYAALAEAAGATVTGPPRYAVRPDDPVPDVPVGHIGLNPISPSGAVVQWTGYLALAKALGGAVFYGGPGEDAAVAAIAGDHPRRVGLSLPAFAAALARCAVFVSNDSGAAHFARACGVPTVVVHGSTTAARTGPHGSLAVEGPDLACRPCYAKSCRFALECLDVPVERVLSAIAVARKPS